MRPAIIFDLDGTLIDSLEDIRAAVNTAFRANGLRTVARSEMPRLVGWGTTGLVERALAPELSSGTLSRQKAMAVAEQITVAYGPDPTARTRVFPGIAGLLRAIDSWNVATAILTNKPDAVVQRLVPKLFGTDRFDVVRGAIDAKPVKPEAAALDSVLADLGVRAAHAVMVGDSEIDIETARAAGVTAFAVTWGYRDARELSGCDAIASDSRQLQQMLHAWRVQQR